MHEFGRKTTECDKKAYLTTAPNTNILVLWIPYELSPYTFTQKLYIRAIVIASYSVYGFSWMAILQKVDLGYGT